MRKNIDKDEHDDDDDTDEDDNIEQELTLIFYVLGVDVHPCRKDTLAKLLLLIFSSYSQE